MSKRRVKVIPETLPEVEAPPVPVVPELVDPLPEPVDEGPVTDADIPASDVPTESEHARLAAAPAEIVPVEIPVAPADAACTEHRFNEVTGRMDRFDASGNQIL